MLSMNEHQIIPRALERLATTTGIKAKWKPGKQEIDGELSFQTAPFPFNIYVEVKREIRQYQLANIFEMAKRYQPFMIVAENIFPTIKEMLRDKKIGYLDTAGNIFINTGGNFIWIDGNKATQEKKRTTNRAFTKTGLRTVFYLLLVEDAINMPYRKLAEATGVALGNIRNIMDGLKDAGFILQIDNRTLKLQNKKALLERWITGYGETLKPTLQLGTYRFWDQGKFRQWQTIPVEVGKTAWGGEPAAEHLTKYLATNELTLYTAEKTKMVTKWKLIPDAKGNVHLYEKFWLDDKADKGKYVPPLLTYADLLLTNDPRCLETAERIYEKYLKNDFE